MLYGSKCWNLNQQQEKRLQAFENNCLRRILNINWTQYVSNRTIRQITGQPLVTDMIKTQRWKYLGHVVEWKTTKHQSQSSSGTQQESGEGEDQRRHYTGHTRGTFSTRISPYNPIETTLWQEPIWRTTGVSSSMTWVPPEAQEYLRSKVKFSFFGTWV